MSEKRKLAGIHDYLKCEDCFFYRAIDGGRAAGTCHKNAPHPIVIQQLPVAWPQVLHDDVCGEYESRRAAAMERGLS